MPRLSLRKQSARSAGWLAALVAIILILIPLHAFLTVWLSSVTGHYTAVRLWKEVLQALMLAGCSLLVRWRQLRLERSDNVWKLITIYLVLLLITGIVALMVGAVSPKAFAYGYLIDSRFLIFFVAVWFISQRTDVLQRHWRQLIVLPALVVICFGLLQIAVLPHDVLRHFGYGPGTIPVLSTIDQKTSYVRIASTLRGANPLGAYLVFVTSVLLALYIQLKQRRYIVGVFAALVVLAATYSRSAWLGMVVGLATFLWLNFNSRRARQFLLFGAGGLIMAALVLTLALRHNTRFENTVFHTDRQSRSATSSNAGHRAAFTNGVSYIIRHPLGGGTGTAGPASAYNKQPARIAENYYVQVGQESGLLGLGLFVAITVVIGRRLYRLAVQGDRLALALFTSLLGLTLVNMLSHAWADDTLAYAWWGLAAVALSKSLVTNRKNVVQ